MELQHYSYVSDFFGDDDDLHECGPRREEIPEEQYVAKALQIVRGYPTIGVPYEPTQIAEHVWLGDQRNAENLPSLRRLRITHVLNCGGGGMGRRGRQIYGAPDAHCGVVDYMELKAQDSEYYDVTQVFSMARCFLDRCRAERGRALVHCEHGVNTSAAVCVAYLLLHRRFRLLEAVHFLKVQRRVILNNEAFVRQLVRYAKERGFLEDDETAVRVKREYKMDKTWQKAYTYDRPRALKY